MERKDSALLTIAKQMSSFSLFNHNSFCLAPVPNKDFPMVKRKHTTITNIHTPEVSW